MRLLIAGLLALILWVPVSASAQYNQYGPYEPYTESLYREGPGIKFFHDGLVVHPGLATELGYDSNVLLANQPVGAGLLRLLAHLDFATLPPQRLDPGAHPLLEFRLGGAFEYRQYLSNDPQIGYAYQLNGLANLDLTINPRGQLSLRIYDNFIFTHDARNLEVASSQTFIPRAYNRAGILGTYRPFNGPLELGLGDAFRVDYYLDDTLSAARSLLNEAELYAQLRVLPQTTIKLDVRSSYIDYFGLNAVLPTAVPLRITFGVNSLLLPSLGASAYVGYGNSFQYGSQVQQFFPGTDTRFNNFIAGAELRLKLPSRMRLAVGWARDFFDSIFATFIKDDRIYLSYDHNLWRGLYAHVQFDTYLRHYGPLIPAAELFPTLGYTGYAVNGVAVSGVPDRSDVLLNLNADLNYRVLSWMELGVSYSLLDDITDVGFVDPARGPQRSAFIKHTVLGRIDIAY